MVGASLQTPQIDSVQEGAAIESTTIESDKNLDEVVGSAQEAATENIQSTQDEVTTQSSSTKSQNDDDGMVGMALPSASDVTVEQNDATQTPTESESGARADEKLSAPLEAPKDDPQVIDDEKVGRNMVKCE